jgi:hypothetical protein
LCLWVVEVTFEDVGALDPELAGLASWNFSLFRRHVLGSLVG